MDFRKVGGQLWIYADHKAEWALIPKYVVWFSEQTTAATNSLTQGTSGKPTQGGGHTRAQPANLENK